MSDVPEPTPAAYEADIHIDFNNGRTLLMGVYTDPTSGFAFAIDKAYVNSYGFRICSPFTMLETIELSPPKDEDGDDEEGAF